MPAQKRAGVTRLRVGIIGLGRMACGYDRPDGPAVQTHIKACLSDQRLELACISDRDPLRARTVKEAWNLSAENVAPEDFFARKLDIVCICTPNETHLAMLAKALECPARLVLCEKPLGRDPEAAHAAIAGLEKAGSTIAVNMLRRWIPGLAGWAGQARAGEFGRPIGATVTYSGGFWNNAVHAIDLLSAFINEEVTAATLYGSPVGDRSAQDPTFSLVASCGKVPLCIRGVDGRIQTVFDVEFLFERGRIRIRDEDGVRAQLDLPVELAAEGTGPELRDSMRFHDKPATLMARVWSNLADHLLHGAPVACSAAAALAGVRMQARFAQCLDSKA